MGKRIRAQRIGRGSPTYSTKPRSFNPKLNFFDYDGVVIDILHDPRRNAPIAKIKYKNGEVGYIVAPKGIVVGDSICKYVMRLKDIQTGIPIFCIEGFPESGPMFCRSPGSYAIILSKSQKSCVIQLPSKKTRIFNPNCKAVIGIPACSGFAEKPFLKAGNKFHKMRAIGKPYPRTSGSAMNPVDHPFGGRTKPGKPKTVSRNAPPGRKVGSIAAKKTGRKK